MSSRLNRRQPRIPLPAKPNNNRASPRVYARLSTRTCTRMDRVSVCVYLVGK